MGYRRVLALALLCCLLCGCSSWLDGSYISVKPHQEQLMSGGQMVVQVSNYAELQTALSDLVDSGQENGVLILKDYEAVTLKTDIEYAVRYIRERYPIGAYAVKDVRYEMGASSGQEAVAVSVSYVHDRSEISQIQTVRGAADMRSAIAAALEQTRSGVVLQVLRYEDADLTQLVADHAAAYPEKVMEIPTVTAKIYPDEGITRVMEVKFTYAHTKEELRLMQTEVERFFSSAELYVTTDAPASVRYDQLYGFLTERFDYKIRSWPDTPSYSLLCEGEGDCKAFATVYAALCRRSGLECQVVTGSRDGEEWCWNIIRRGDGYAHLDPTRCCLESGLRLRSDEEMVGYEWDRGLYPVCQPTGPAEE